MNKKISSFLAIAIIIIASAGVLMGIFFLTQDIDDKTPYKPTDSVEEESSDPTELEDIKRFVSEKEFNDYLAQAMDLTKSYYGASFRQADIGLDAIEDSLEISAPMASDSVAKEMPERYSETNVQVLGVDEPDIVKTDGMNIYTSLETFYYHPRYSEDNKTKIIQAFPVDDLALKKEINNAGKLLLKENILVIFSNDKILGYNVVNIEDPELKWEIKIDEKTQLVDTRLYENTIYLVINNRVIRDNPCIIEPLAINEKPIEISCLDVYYPGRIIPTDTVYTLLTIDLLSGEKEKEISFVGSTSNSIVYMSLNNFYLSYFEPIQLSDFMINFFKEKCTDIFPKNVIEKLEKLTEYDISSQAKETELQVILGEYLNSLTADEEMKMENEMINRIPKFYQENKYNLESTGIVKIGLSDLKIQASGNVPGKLLNQFALDEYKDNLRVATTIGENLSWMLGSEIESSNDVYVLNKNLEKTGQVQELGLGERIYSVRFLQDKGYVVTFREIDPFYILDLSDPVNPEMKGELKIPGYSSYLHPINENHILGIGKEGRNVKISLFDIQDPYNPKEVDKYFLNDYWSEILNNHHAFLLDSKHEIFFLPGSKGAYIFSFKNNKFELIRTVQQSQVKRALYIDDYLYIISTDNIIVLDQNNWETIKDIKI